MQFSKVKRTQIFVPILLCLFLFVPMAHAKVFSNKFIEFQLPNKWSCRQDGTEWVCQSQNEEKRREAIIVLAAKIRDPALDSLVAYERHLKKKQSYKSSSGQQVISEPRYTKEISINSRKWIDSLHLHSEIPDFYTRYMATIANNLGILLTFSVRKDKYTEYSQQIDALVRSLKAFRKPGDINAASNLFAEGGGEDYLEPEILFPEDKPCPKGQRRSKKDGQCKKVKKDGGDDDLITILALIAILAGIFIYMKKRR